MDKIGGNLLDIEDVAKRLDEVGDETGQTTKQTHDHAELLLTEVSEAMVALKKSFNETAQLLNDKIKVSSDRLNDSIWDGKSRAAAEVVRDDLSRAVGDVITQANENLDSEKQAFEDRINALINHIDNEFGKVMGEVDLRYKGLAQAARDTKANFEAADETIKVG